MSGVACLRRSYFRRSRSVQRARLKRFGFACADDLGRGVDAATEPDNAKWPFQRGGYQLGANGAAGYSGCLYLRIRECSFDRLVP